MRNGKSVLAFTAGTLLLAASAFGQTTTTTYTRTSTLPPIGLALTETIQVNLTNTATASTAGTAASCGGSVSFLNAAGAVVGTATTYTATSGQTVSVKLPYASAGAAGQRAIIRPVITVTGASNVPCALDTSLETYDTATGVTHIYQSGGGPEGGPGRR